MKKKVKIGLALGSGAFRGFAHIGVLQVLEENNIPISFLSGSSVGALVAAYYSLYQDTSGLEETFLKSKKNLYLIADLGWRNGLVSGLKYEKFIEYLLGKKTFKDAKIPLSILATDLVSGKPHIFQTGKLTTAVRASASVPLIFESTKEGNKNFVDGALSRPVPAKELLEMGAEKVISVNLYHKNEFNNKKFNLTKTASRSISIILYNFSQSSLEGSDVVINPDTSEQIRKGSLANYFNQEVTNQMIQIGRKATLAKLKEIKAWL
ncbi:MAG: hypothetical protein PWQ35_322 [Patescibacteria group bacterium]|nr:hypothetical protein [Patescibacteria group bacterium]